MTLIQIEQLTKFYADARSVLTERVRELTELLDDAKRRRLAGIKSALSAAAECESQLRAAIDGSNGLFERPRTHVFHGVKVGFQKGRGGLELGDEEQVVRLIEKHFPEQADVLIVTKKRPAKEALKQLEAKDLARLGVSIIDTTDEIVIKPVDGEIDKVVAALLKDATDGEA